MPTHYRTCHLCEAMCGLTIITEGDRVSSIRGDADDPFSRGHICPKGPALADLHADPDRLRQPMRRTRSTWKEISWDEALDAAAKGLHAVQAEHGDDAVAAYVGNPAVHNHGNILFTPHLLRGLHTRHRYSATSADQLPQMLVAYLMFGHQLLLPIPDLDRAELLVMIGANPIVSGGSIMTAGDVRARLRGIQSRGGALIVVDPRRSETAAIADQHLFIRPGTDALLLLAMLHTILDEGLERPGRLLEFVEGLPRLRAALAPFDLARAAAGTGIPARDIRALALDLIERRGVIYGRVGACTQAFGSLTQWAINLLNIFSGALDRPGGAMFTRPAVDLVAPPLGMGIGRGHFGRWHSKVRGLPEFGGELPIASFAEDLLRADDDPDPDHNNPALDVRPRALLTVAGNPALSSPNGPKLERALEGLDFMVSIDLFLNETTRHADLILPPCSPLERSHYDIVFNALAVRNVAKWSGPVFDPPPGALHDWQITHGLLTRLQQLRGRDDLRTRVQDEARARLGPDGMLDLAMRAGPYGKLIPGRGLERKRLAQNPHGLDLGALEPCLPERMPEVHGGQILLTPEPLLRDLGRLERCFPPATDVPARAPGDFVLIGRRQLRTNNSWMHNCKKLVAGKPRCTLMMHPDDALALDLTAGDEVVIRSRVGHVVAPLAVTDELMPGVVSLPHGFGHNRPGTRTAVASAHAGVSINDLTDELEIDELSGTAAFSGVAVQVSLAAEAAE